MPSGTRRNPGALRMDDAHTHTLIYIILYIIYYILYIVYYIYMEI